MSDEPRDPNRPQDRKNPAMGGKYRLVSRRASGRCDRRGQCGGARSKVKLKYSDLEALIQQGLPAKHPKAAIKVRRDGEAAGRAVL